MRQRLDSPADYLRAYPRLCSHIICDSLGYATPTKAADILMHAHRREPDYCEWIWSCYNCNPLSAVRAAIRSRHHHHGYMAEYKRAKALVDRANATGEEPSFASWF